MSGIGRRELDSFFQELLVPETYKDYGPNGLQVEGQAHGLQRIAFSVSATREAIELAVQWKAHALVVHHGLFWKFTGARPIVGPLARRLSPMMKADLNLFAYHLPLDGNMTVGHAYTLATKLDLLEIEPFGEYKGLNIGAKGNFKIPLSVDKLEEILGGILGRKPLVARPEAAKKIRSIGIITGGANNEWVHALEENLDAYLTGEISEYNWHDAREAGVVYFAGGHHATETHGILSLMEATQERFTKVETRFFDSKNPV